VAQLQAEIARLAAERAEAEWRHDAVVRRSEELARMLVELRDERDLHRPKCGQTASSARVPAAEITMAEARTDEDRADHHLTERFRAAGTFSAPPDGEPAAWSEWLPKLASVTSSPFPGPGEDAETSERRFPREADLALVGDQAEILDQLLRTGPTKSLRINGLYESILGHASVVGTTACRKSGARDKMLPWNQGWD
jgi:hypothetical protein